MRWIGSIGWDGYPDGLPKAVIEATSEDDYVAAVLAMLSTREDATLIYQGWPWPWDDSATTDYAYAWFGDRVVASNFGHSWFAATVTPITVGSVPFPNMKAVQNIAWDNRSGLIVFETKEPDDAG